MWDNERQVTIGFKQSSSLVQEKVIDFKVRNLTKELCENFSTLSTDWHAIGWIADYNIEALKVALG